MQDTGGISAGPAAVSFLASLPVQPVPAPRHPCLPWHLVTLRSVQSLPLVLVPDPRTDPAGSTLPLDKYKSHCSPFPFIAALIYFISKLLLCDDRLHYSVYKRQLLALIS